MCTHSDEVAACERVRERVNELLLEGVDNTSCFIKLCRVFSSLSVKKKFQIQKAERFEKLYIAFFILQILIFYLFTHYL